MVVGGGLLRFILQLVCLYEFKENVLIEFVVLLLKYRIGLHFKFAVFQGGKNLISEFVDIDGNIIDHVDGIRFNQWGEVKGIA